MRLIINYIKVKITYLFYLFHIKQENGTLKFGGMISSSNKYDTKNPDPVVTVITDNYLVWYMSLNLEPSKLYVVLFHFIF